MRPITSSETPRVNRPWLSKDEVGQLRHTGFSLKGFRVAVLMQKLTLIVCISFITASCGGVPPEQTVTKGGLVYKIRDSKPFSGTVAGYAREGYRARKLKYAKRYKKGILHGDTKFWYANGKLESIEPYTNGKINGIVTQYYQSGRLRARIHMVDGQRGGSKGEQFWREDKRETKDFSKRFFK